MKYENGKDIFPERLLRQIQKYAAGKLVYIPAMEQKKDWGESSAVGYAGNGKYAEFIEKYSHFMK